MQREGELGQLSQLFSYEKGETNGRYIIKSIGVQ